MLDFLPRMKRSCGCTLRDVGEMKATAALLLVTVSKLHLAAQRCLCSKRVQRTVRNKEAATQSFQPLRTHPVALPGTTQERFINKQRQGSRQMSGNRCEFVILTSDLPEQEINFLHESQDCLTTTTRTAARREGCLSCLTDRKCILPGFGESE